MKSKYIVGCHGEPKEITIHCTESLDITGNHKTLQEISCNCKISYASLRNPMKLQELIRNHVIGDYKQSCEIVNHRMQLHEIARNTGKSLEIKCNHRKVQEIIGNHMEFHEATANLGNHLKLL